eukprot:CAMPEP_0116906946 /NCGR_PEP_ID=MMETSP0467-20121206/12815_1 /TAXON_ID=283647 /ORGANISM="Mesodinium pulex, Strain SPMC105" /LENGTH=49 /DNA_ID=CAMNT_0004581875 /DNA_START=116 /DNA_END=265 /DNA_ORIENTATION=-
MTMETASHQPLMRTSTPANKTSSKGQEKDRDSPEVEQELSDFKEEHADE